MVKGAGYLVTFGRNLFGGRNGYLTGPFLAKSAGISRLERENEGEVSESGGKGQSSFHGRVETEVRQRVLGESHHVGSQRGGRT